VCTFFCSYIDLVINVLECCPKLGAGRCGSRVYGTLAAPVRVQGTADHIWYSVIGTTCM
jgi:hypothetical protein